MKESNESVAATQNGQTSAKQAAANNLSYIEGLVSSAVELQAAIVGLRTIPFVAGAFMDETFEMEVRLEDVIRVSSNILGRAYVERSKKEYGYE